jgi:hypothetical protein
MLSLEINGDLTRLTILAGLLAKHDQFAMNYFWPPQILRTFSASDFHAHYRSQQRFNET